MMKKIFTVLAVLAIAACCKPKTPETPKLAVDGMWELSAAQTKVSLGGEEVSVYISFTEGAFVLYQKIGAGRYSVFTGSYSIDQDKAQLSGTYASGKAWGPYDCTCADGTLTLESGTEKDTYTKIDGIPESVTSNVY